MGQNPGTLRTLNRWLTDGYYPSHIVIIGFDPPPCVCWLFLISSSLSNPVEAMLPPLPVSNSRRRKTG